MTFRTTYCLKHDCPLVRVMIGGRHDPPRPYDICPRCDGEARLKAAEREKRARHFDKARSSSIRVLVIVLISPLIALPLWYVSKSVQGVLFVALWLFMAVIMIGALIVSVVAV